MPPILPFSAGPHVDSGDGDAHGFHAAAKKLTDALFTVAGSTVTDGLSQPMRMPVIR